MGLLPVSSMPRVTEQTGEAWKRVKVTPSTGQAIDVRRAGDSAGEAEVAEGRIVSDDQQHVGPTISLFRVRGRRKTGHCCTQDQRCNDIRPHLFSS